MPLSHIQGTTNSGQSGSSLAATFGASVTSGNIITGFAAWVGTSDGTDFLTNITDNQGNAYTIGANSRGFLTGSNYYLIPFWSNNVVTNAPTTITATVNVNTTTFAVVMIDEWSGLASNYLVTGQNHFVNTGVAGALSATINTVSGGLCIGYAVDVQSGGLTAGQTVAQYVATTWMGEYTTGAGSTQTMSVTNHGASGAILGALSLANTALTNTTYYVSPTGSDSANGTSPSTPWQTLGHVASQVFNAGDTILLEGGQTFSSNLILTQANYGIPPTAINPITLSSYGAGNSTISPTAADAIELQNIGGMLIENLILVGDNTANMNGINTINDNSVGSTSDIILSSLTISGFGRAGILGVFPNIVNTVKNITVQNCNVSNCTANVNILNNITAGICFGTNISVGTRSSDGGIFTATLAAANIVVKNSVVENCPGSTIPNTPYQTSTGIFIGNTLLSANAITRNFVSGNGANETKGNAGIECNWCSGGASLTWVVTQNEVNNQISVNAPADGDGIDFDSGCINLGMEQNYIHDCDGVGIFFFNFGAFTHSGCAARYNILQNNAKLHDFEIWVSSGTGSTGPQNIAIYNNTVYDAISRTATLVIMDGVTAVSGIFENNIIINGATGPDLNIFFSVVTNFTANNNLYLAASTAYNWNWNGTVYTTFASYKTASGQDANSLAGVDPQLTAPGTGGTYNGYSPPQPTAYDLAAGSPAAGTGIVIADGGSQDYYGNPVPNSTGSGYSIGAYNAPSTTPEQPSMKPDYVGGWVKGTTPALSNTVTNIKPFYGQLASLTAYNPNASAAYIQVFDVLAANVVLGTTVPSFILPLAQASSLSMSLGDNGLQFNTAISIAATTTATGSTAPSSALTVSYAYL